MYPKIVHSQCPLVLSVIAVQQAGGRRDEVLAELSGVCAAKNMENLVTLVRC